MKPSDHKRGCEGRSYTCTCGHDDALLAERDELVAENARLWKALQGMLEIQDALDEFGSCENEFINPRVSAARAAFAGKETGHDA